MKKRIVAVGPEEGPLRKLDRILWRSSFEVHRVPLARGVQAICESVKPQLVIASIPLPDMQIKAFLSSIRAAIPPSRQPAIVLLSDERDSAELDDCSVPNLVVLDVGLQEEQMQAEVLKLIDAAARVSKRLLLRLELNLGAGRLLRMLQTENMSDTGMLVRSSELFPLGTEIEFEFSVPGDEKPIQGRAEIVRHSTPEIEKVQGLGVRFTSFSADGHERLRAFLAYRRGLAS